jgi:hypothetical protein
MKGVRMKVLGTCLLWLAIVGCSSVNEGSGVENSEQNIATGTYSFGTLTTSGKCIDVNRSGSADGTNIQQWTCNGSGAQSFRVEDLGGGVSRLVHTPSGKCMDISGAGSADGTNIQLWTCNGTGAQTFRITDAGGGNVRMINPNSNKCVDISGAGTSDGSNVQLWTCNGTNAQLFRPIGSTTNPDPDPPKPDPNPSDILVPAQGAWLGQYYGDGSIADTSARLGRTLRLHLTYYDFTHDWTGGETKRDLDAGRIPFVNWEVFDTPLDQIINGSKDAMLAQRAQQAKALGKKIFVDFGAEMNGEWSPWGGAQNGKSAAKYIAAYRHVHKALASADNLVWVWCPNVTDEPREAWNQAMNYYPGDEYVDWTCVDGYNWGSSNGGSWQSFQDVFKNIYPKLAAKNKPIMIGEMASAEVGGSKGPWIDAMLPTLKNTYPMIRGVIWFDVNKETDWRIRSSSASLSAFVRMANDPYFNP